MESGQFPSTLQFCCLSMECIYPFPAHALTLDEAGKTAGFLTVSESDI